jgi:flagellar motor protein MotB
MTKITLSILFLFILPVLFAQGTKSGNQTVSDCAGAMNIFKSGKYTIQFTGSGGSEKEFANYPSLVDVSDLNAVWVAFIPEYDGVLNLNASITQDYLQMVIFEEQKKDLCLELGSGVAEIKRLVKDKNSKNIGLNVDVKSGFLYPMEIKAGKKILIGFSTVEKSKAILQLDFNFKEENSALKAANETKVMDLRDDEFAPSLTISVRDKETKQPVIANLTIEGFKELSATFKASDFYFNLSRSGKGFVKCDAEGYFFFDKEESFTANTNQEIIIYLDPLGKGKTMQIEEIEFQPGTSEFLQGSDSKLRRLKDFMALNADVSIEIQGHVHADGDNGFAAQKLSEARAKRVMNYLVSQGINKERMTAVGYGNTKPVYLKPKFAYEEQANRRVEIVVK